MIIFAFISSYLPRKIYFINVIKTVNTVTSVLPPVAVGGFFGLGIGYLVYGGMGLFYPTKTDESTNKSLAVWGPLDARFYAVPDGYIHINCHFHI